MPSLSDVPLRLRVQFSLAVGLAGLLLLAGFLAGSLWWSPADRFRWIVLAGLVQTYLLLITLTNLPANHRQSESILLAGLGYGNTLTLGRGQLMGMLAGFLAAPRPAGIYAWLPGCLYILAALPDFIDGYLARRFNQATRLGSILDLNVDSLGVLTTSLLAFAYGILPWWYLPIGLARYIFVAGIELRKRLGRPVHPLPFSYRRRGFASLSMGLMFVILFPPFQPPATWVGAAIFGLLFLGGFLVDWGYVSGGLPADFSNRFARWKELLLKDVPVALRVSMILLGLPTLTRHLADPDLVWLAVAESLALAGLLLGILPRVSAIFAVILVGFTQTIAPLDGLQLLSIPVLIGLIVLGGGRWSLFPIDEKLVYRQTGEQVGGEAGR